MERSNSSQEISMADEVERLVFEDLEPKEFPVRISGKEYVLVEASAGVEVKYHDASSKEMQVDPETKRVKVGAVHGAEPLAISKCLFELVVMSNAKIKRVAVPLDVVLRWPPRVYQGLFKKLAEMSPGLVRGNQAKEEVQKEKEKNSQEPGTDTSDSQPGSENNSTSSSDGEDR